ncbi:hypothetical protein CR969_02780 [Candidatus Saccharibacteria bacterium]|nr:MAG: hypothetical protein CR969_02780 [Candidatus Saccharibacteria bacterium]
MDELFFEKFSKASKLNQYNLQDFARQMENYDAKGKELKLDYPDLATKLPDASGGKLGAIAKKRRSCRDFSDKPLSAKKLSSLLSGARAWNGLESRAFPSAGASYVSEMFCISWAVKGFEDQKLYYDAQVHGTVRLPGGAPIWDEIQDKINVPVNGRPAALIINAIFPDRVTAKYGERGGRFALLEAGAVMQQLSLATAENKLGGLVIGGLVDDYWLEVLGLDKTKAQVTFGYLVGLEK